MLIRRVLAAVAVTGAVLALAPVTAAAHPLSTTAVLLEVGADQVTGQVQLPIDRLAIAVGRPELTTVVAARPAEIDGFRRYLGDHLAATNATDGAPWTTSVSGGRVEAIDGVDHLVYDVALVPPEGVEDLQLHDDAIVHRLLSHKIFVSSRPAGAAAYTAVGVLDWEAQDLLIPVQGAAVEQGFGAAVRLGIHHIAEGADHVLFLIMLLLPAPLLARSGRWVPTTDLPRSCWRVVHVVTAFAIGHSITLALAASGVVHAPTRMVESMIAASVLVSGIHALRPLVRGGETWIAAGFGLMHGLAFAALLGSLDLRRGSLVVALLGFNVGIELTQLIVVALVMPSLLLLSRSRIYPAVRVALASVGVVLAAAWLAERTTLIRANPLEGIPAALVAHPFVLAAALALVAVLARVVPRTWAVRT